MRKLSKDKKDSLILTSLGTVFFCVFALQFFVAGQQKSIRNFENEIKKMKGNVSKLNKLNSMEQLITRDFNTATNKISRLESFMAQGDPFSWVIAKTEEFNRNHSSVNLTVRTGNRDQHPVFPGFEYESMRFKIVGDATFHELGSFISDIENTNPFVRIENLQMSENNGIPPTGTSSWEPDERLDFSFDFVVLLKGQEGS